ncbi:hypothetical protein B0H63DRAFT_487306 [Podospora didyma]|uniref:Uncharacterized protein n=1 Tax=Podospora didyma TaxID=330526 RepID=A0AAE0K5T4_9PEZI|nr:hypothetical protein B0H63DRAFT_487306 [Podospora didyma]
MPTKSHHRSRSSIDRVFDLLADLGDNQISTLLDDLNHTTSSNVPVSKAIALFEPGSTKPTRKFGRSSSPVRTLRAELERRHSKRISSAPEPSLRPKTAAASPASSTTSRFSTITTSPPAPELPTHDRPRRPSLTLAPPTPEPSAERPKTATEPEPANNEFRARSYKRVSRPLFLSPTATAELHELLTAYLYETPVSSATSTTSSPVTAAAGASLAPFSRHLEHPEPEPALPGLELLEPSPMRTPYFTFSRAGMAPTDTMSGIFEVLASR